MEPTNITELERALASGNDTEVRAALEKELSVGETEGKQGELLLQEIMARIMTRNSINQARLLNAQELLAQIQMIRKEGTDAKDTVEIAKTKKELAS